MPILRLAEHAVFDDTDDAGVILDNRQGVYLSLNGVATVMLRAALRHETLDELIAELRGRIDAPETTLRAGYAKLVSQLGDQALLAGAEERR
ncbi:unnamed protein product [[Actinomadura] parvosata subsp. kistnae]|uniref:PqqD family protein n=1 Tax=[Actinomadura] parvosata TaxID=1955412 RepID=UPI000D28E2F4|nr:unnamed protein product [Actinomadura parvosata subsp. kistnae]